MAKIKITQTGSPIRRDKTQRATLVGLGLNKLHRTVEVDETPEVLGQVRKVAHLAEYAILAALLWRAVYSGTNLKIKMSTLFVIVWLVSTLIAVSDEFHQSFVTSRTASIGDVRIDMIGAIFGLIFCRSCTLRALRPLAKRGSQIE